MKVLTTNHIFEMILEFLSSRSWSQAVERVMPSRKLKEAEREEMSALVCGNFSSSFFSSSTFTNFDIVRLVEQGEGEGEGVKRKEERGGMVCNVIMNWSQRRDTFRLKDILEKRLSRDVKKRFLDYVILSFPHSSPLLLRYNTLICDLKSLWTTTDRSPALLLLLSKEMREREEIKKWVDAVISIFHGSQIFENEIELIKFIQERDVGEEEEDGA